MSQSRDASMWRPLAGLATWRNLKWWFKNLCNNFNGKMGLRWCSLSLPMAALKSQPHGNRLQGHPPDSFLVVHAFVEKSAVRVTLTAAVRHVHHALQTAVVAAVSICVAGFSWAAAGKRRLRLEEFSKYAIKHNNFQVFSIMLIFHKLILQQVIFHCKPL